MVRDVHLILITWINSSLLETRYLFLVWNGIVNELYRVLFIDFIIKEGNSKPFSCNNERPKSTCSFTALQSLPSILIGR